LTHVIGDWSLI